MTRTSASEAETADAGRELARNLQPGDVVLLFGELGAGKTAFVRGLAEGLGIAQSEVSSPTFTIVQHYGAGRVPLLHVDLYRLDPKEVDDLGLEELGAEAVTAIEWADRLPRALPGAIHVALRHAGENTREIEVTNFEAGTARTPEP